MKSLLILPWAVLSIGMSRAQPPPGSMPTVDTVPLFQRYVAATTDTARISASRALVKATIMDDRVFGRWCDSLLKYAERTADTASILHAYKGRIASSMMRGDQLGMIATARSSLVILEAQKDWRQIIETRTVMAKGMIEMGDVEGALAMLISNTRTVDRHQLETDMLDLTHYLLGEVYRQQGEYTQAITNYERCVAETKVEHLMASRKRLALLGLSATYRAMGQAAKASEQLKKFRALAPDPHDPNGDFEDVLLEEGLVQIDLGQRDSAEATLRLALLATDTMRHHMQGIRVRLALASLVPDHERLKLLLEARSLALPKALLEDAVRADRELVPLLARAGRMKEAVSMAEEALALGDSLYDERKDRALQQMKVKFETDLKDKEIIALQQEQDLQLAREEEQRLRIERQRQFIIAAAIIGVLLLISAVFAYRAFRIKRKAAAELQLKNAEVLQQKERAEESERAKDRFLANVSHEVRTPLNAIMGFTGLLMHEAKDERSARFLGNIRDAGDNLLVVINDVLDLSRIEAGRLTLIREPFELHRCLYICAEILQHRATEQRNTLRVEIHDDAPQWLLGDSARLTQIVLNLTGNALKFTTNGTVTITAAPSAQGIVLRVRDTGIGIPPEKLNTVFERFTQVHEGDQRNYGGTGLGLSIVKELVELHKGSVTVESETGRGTTFTVHLPLHATEAPADARAFVRTPTSDSLEGRTVLVAEDNDMNALVTEETLARHFPKARIERVNDGDEVLARMQHGTDVALILMDVQMPKRDGISATRAIRAMEGSVRNVPIIALTASVLPNDLSRCIDAGMDACVSKPFKADELLAAIARLTGTQAKVPASAIPQGDMLTALFKRMVPERLKALKEARANKDLGKVLRVVHSMRPQLVSHDEPRFAVLCADVLSMDPQCIPIDWGMRIERLAHAVEQALAQLA